MYDGGVAVGQFNDLLVDSRQFNDLKESSGSL